jgi:hypothetical protein
MTQQCSEFNSNVVTFLKISTSLSFSEFDVNVTTFTERTLATAPNLWQKRQRLAKKDTIISVI